jgi:HD-GYP domain-containing protein (c-di-GMP phosphodiesterase class II)
VVRYNIDDIQEEMVLGESIFLPSGELLLAAGYRIKERYRERLKQLGYRNILIEMEGTESVIPESTVSDTAQREMHASIETSGKELCNAMQQFRNKSVEKVRDILKDNKQVINKHIMTSGTGKVLEQFIDDIMSQTSILLNLSALKQTEPGLFTHAINVTITALCIGKKYKFSYEEMKQLGIGAINYDIGLVALPKEMFEKSFNTFNDEELKQYRQHTVFGFLMLSQNPGIPSTSSAVALQHHEREDGSGYPQGLRGDNRPPLKDISRKNVIHRFAEIVAVADIYDTLISGRRIEDVEPCPPRDAIKKIIQMSGEILNSEIVKTLVSIIPLFPVGARIRVTNAPTPLLIGYYGVVAKDNPENLENPQIILYETKNHIKIKPVLIDTAKHSGFTLELVI